MVQAGHISEPVAPVLIAENDQVTATALEAAVLASSPFLTCLVVRDYAALQAQLLRQPHSALLLGMGLPGLENPETCIGFVQGRCPETPVLLVGRGNHGMDGESALAIGACGFAATDLGAGPLLDELRKALAQCSDQLAHLTPRSNTSTIKLEDLSMAQRRVLDQLIQGKTNRDIADSLCLSEATIKSHLYAIYRIIGVKNRSQLIVKMGVPA